MTIPVLMYHAITKQKTSNKYFLDESTFSQQLEVLKAKQYSCILIEDNYRSYLECQVQGPEKKVAITFDDGNESDYSLALPLLKKADLKATFFITTDFINKEGYMNERQIQQLRKEGMSVQSHAKSHSFLNTLALKELNDELSTSKKVLEDIISERVSFISFPGGRFNRDVLACAHNNGYDASFCSIPFALKKINETYLVGRYGIKQTLDLKKFEEIVQQEMIVKYLSVAEYYGKNILKKILGNNVYHYLWTELYEKANRAH